jgi:hypothetical protein
LSTAILTPVIAQTSVAKASFLIIIFVKAISQPSRGFCLRLMFAGFTSLDLYTFID